MIGVFLCHRGTNIAGVVDIAALRGHFSKLGYHVEDHLFLCSQFGHEMIKSAVREKGLDRVVIASCSPKHHGEVFKECVGEVINSYMWGMANIREQCAWTTSDRGKATQKAKALISGAIRRVEHHRPIESIEFPEKLSCCGAGGGVWSGDEQVSLGILDRKMKFIKESGADCILDTCPFCHLQLDQGQKRLKTRYEVPVLHLNQLIGLSFGVKDKVLGMHKHMVSTRDIARKAKKARRELTSEGVQGTAESS